VCGDGIESEESGVYLSWCGSPIIRRQGYEREGVMEAIGLSEDLIGALLGELRGGKENAK
jgi:hypothetical protein